MIIKSPPTFSGARPRAAGNSKSESVAKGGWALGVLGTVEKPQIHECLWPSCQGFLLEMMIVKANANG